MVVDRISLLYTVFTRTDKMQIVQVPNIVLNNLWIENVTRSKAMVESIEINVSYDTSFEDIELLRLEMEKFVRSSDNSRDFQPDFNISVGGVGNLDKMTLFVSIKHKSNWHNDRVRSTRRSKFMCALAMALKKIPIYGPGGGSEALGGPTNPTYAVSVSNDFAMKSREEAAMKKEESRMMPTHQNQTAEEAFESEKQAVTELNTRTLIIDTTGPWDSRDDRSIMSRSPSENPRRSRDIESVRNELLKKESQRGRRKAGEGLSGLTPTDGNASGYPHSMISPRLQTFDEEAQTGLPPAHLGQSHNEGLVNRQSSHRAPRSSMGDGDEDTLHPMHSSVSHRHVSRGLSLGRRSPRGPSPGDQR